MGNKSLKIKNLSVKVGNTKLLYNVSAIFFAGRVNTIIGPNGAGKTTLFNAISGLIPIETGKVILNGKEIQDKKHYQRAKLGIGRLFQDVKIFDQMTVLENVLTAFFSDEEANLVRLLISPKKLKEKRKIYEEKAENLLQTVGLLELKTNKAENLSFGQQKLLAIARLLAKDFKVLLLDEPTAGLSKTMTEKVLELISHLKSRGKIVILIEHDMEFVKNISDWVYFMYEGKISYFGETHHILLHEHIRDVYICV